MGKNISVKWRSIGANEALAGFDEKSGLLYYLDDTKDFQYIAIPSKIPCSQSHQQPSKNCAYLPSTGYYLIFKGKETLFSNVGDISTVYTKDSDFDNAKVQFYCAYKCSSEINLHCLLFPNDPICKSPSPPPSIRVNGFIADGNNIDNSSWPSNIIDKVYVNGTPAPDDVWSSGEIIATTTDGITSSDKITVFALSAIGGYRFLTWGVLPSMAITEPGMPRSFSVPGKSGGTALAVYATQPDPCAALLAEAEHAQQEAVKYKEALDMHEIPQPRNPQTVAAVEAVIDKWESIARSKYAEYRDCLKKHGIES